MVLKEETFGKGDVVTKVKLASDGNGYFYIVRTINWMKLDMKDITVLSFDNKPSALTSFSSNRQVALDLAS